MRFFDRPGPLVFAHRGGCALGPENTLLAFDRGLAAGADGLEIDVHLSLDGTVVVHHDDTLDRCTNAVGPIAARTAAELTCVDAASRWVPPDTAPMVPRLPGGPDRRDPALTAIPRLRDVLDRYPGVPIIVEMKVDSAAMGQAVVDELRATGAVDRVCVAGYGQRSLDAVRARMPDVATSASHGEVRLAFYRSSLRWPVRRVAYDGYQVPERAGLLRVVAPRFIRDAHEAGLPVQVWTVDEVKAMERLLGGGVDALITNRPDLAAGVRDRTRGRTPEQRSVRGVGADVERRDEGSKA